MAQCLASTANPSPTPKRLMQLEEGERPGQHSVYIRRGQRQEQRTQRRKGDRVVRRSQQALPSRPASVSAMSTSFVEAGKLQPTAFEVQYFDEYDFYNLTDRYTSGASRKGRTKKEASENTNRSNPCGHERKIVDKLQRTEAKKKDHNVQE
ncbi:nuclear protein 1 [Rhinatrema bivittatum]|uniref:nuclear protein 1 n=1 Tax=Rhinatrema bivittatum TaxID=194408 RepID=UPI001129580D|nr:nuclear protein 1 [Rhinatrema bivittatum]